MAITRSSSPESSGSSSVGSASARAAARDGAAGRPAAASPLTTAKQTASAQPASTRSAATQAATADRSRRPRRRSGAPATVDVTTVDAATLDTAAFDVAAAGAKPAATVVRRTADVSARSARSAHTEEALSSSPFAALGLGRPIVQAVLDKGYTTPSPIQQQCIPAVLAGRDVMAAAQTGTGKTAGFTLPMLERLRHGPHARNNLVRALVLTPTRELAAQVAENVAAYSRHLDLRSDVVFGGVKINPQMMRLRGGADVLVATPGRLMDLAQQNAIKLGRVEILVLDEADRMLDMGFIRDIQKILALLPAQRQNLLFSATFEASIRKLATSLLHNPVQLQATPENRTATTVEHVLHPCDMDRKPELLGHLIRSNNWQQVLVFSRTKHGANRIAERLSKEGMAAAAIHGNKSQGARTRALAGFKSGEVRVLVATDIAARGIDIHQLPHVVNLDLPNQAEDYVHRIGRTGRAGCDGHAVSLVAAEEHELLRAIERLIGNPLPRQAVPGFEPTVLTAPPLDLSGGRGRGGRAAAGGGARGGGRSARPPAGGSAGRARAGGGSQAGHARNR